MPALGHNGRKFQISSKNYETFLPVLNQPIYIKCIPEYIFLTVKNIWVPVVIGGDNLPSPVKIGLTDLPNIGGPVAPPGPLVLASLLYNKRDLIFFGQNLENFDQSVRGEQLYYSRSLTPWATRQGRKGWENKAYCRTA